MHLSDIYHLSNIFSKKNGTNERSNKDGMAVAMMKGEDNLKGGVVVKILSAL